jgi:nucleotide-binding universal stress UspA family protein
MGGRIVVGVDGSAGADRALAFALEEARLRGADVVVIHAWSFPAVTYTPFGPGPLMSETDLESAEAEIVERALERVDTSGVQVSRKLVVGGSAPVLLEAAEDAELLVVGTRGHGGFAGLLLGSTSQHLAHHPPCPLVIVP